MRERNLVEMSQNSGVGLCKFWVSWDYIVGVCEWLVVEYYGEKVIRLCLQIRGLFGKLGNVLVV